MSPYTGAVPELDRRDEDPEVFFAEGNAAHGLVQHAQAVCHGCPVRIQCGQFAIRTGEFYGVWGGMSQNQLRQRRQRFTSRARTDTRAPA